MIKYNNFVGNTNSQIDVYRSYPVINFNNFSYNANYTIRNFSGSNVNAKHNWWGTIVENEIDEMIWDGNDIDDPDYPLGNVEYIPFEISIIDSAGIQN